MASGHLCGGACLTVYLQRRVAGNTQPATGLKRSASPSKSSKVRRRRLTGRTSVVWSRQLPVAAAAVRLDCRTVGVCDIVSEFHFGTTVSRTVCVSLLPHWMPTSER